MQVLILALIVVATYNATEAMLGKKLHWSLVLYWSLVAMTYFFKAAGK